MAETMAPDFVTPPKGVHRFPVTSIVPTGRPLDEGIKLFLNKDLEGFVLEPESEGLWLSPVENTVTPRATGGGSLRNRRWADGDSFLVISLHSPSPAHMYDMFARLVEVVTDQGDYFDLVVFDPYSQEARRRTFLYESGLENLGEVTGTYHRVGVTAKFLSPFWRGPERVVVERIAPPVKPLITADPGVPVNRWDDPEFSDTTAYEPWFVVDGGLEKNGTGAQHGVWAVGHDIEVSPGETISITADLSYVDGPQVGNIQVRVRAFDADDNPVSGGLQPYPISESYPGTYTGTWRVPDDGVAVQIGFYTDEDVHANTRVRIDNLDVKREVRYLATYEWEDTPHASPSIKRDGNGNIVARNYVINGDFENGLTGWTWPSSQTESASSTTLYNGQMWGGLGGRLLQALPSESTRYSDVRQEMSFPVGAGQWIGVSGYVANRGGNRTRLQVTSWVDGSPHYSVSAWSSTSFYTGGFIHQAFEIPGDATTHRVQIQTDKTAGVSGQHFWADKITLVVAGNESDALELSAEYFDGDTPDVVDEGSREGAYSYPFFPVFLADSTVQGEHELRVEGDAPVWPVWEITGPGRDVEIIGPCGSRLFVEGEVTTPITIVTEPGKRSIRDASGLIWDRMKPGDDQFFALEPGEQTIKMTMVGGNPESTIKAVYSENWKTPRGTAQGMIRGGAS